jgi:translation initiation factor 4G
MYECIEKLIAKTDDSGEFVSWMEVQDEAYLDLLCRLLHTVGSKMDDLDGNKIDFFFHRITELSRDKTLNSRIRFSLEEVIQLRRNNWVTRREEEGPAMLNEIHQKAAAEEYAKQHKDQQQYNQQGGNRFGNQQQQQRPQGGQFGGRPGPSDNRGPQQGSQQQDARGNRSIAPALGQGGYGPMSGAGGYQGERDQRGGGLSGRGGHGQGQGQGPAQGQGYNNNNRNQPQQQQQQEGSNQRKGADSERSHSAAQQPSSSQGQSTANVLTETQITDRVSATVEEYLNIRDAGEAQQSLKELPSRAIGSVILKVIKKYLNSNKSDVKSDLLQLLNALSSMLKDAKSEVEAALTRCEELLMLCDTITDYKQVRQFYILYTNRFLLYSICEYLDV